MMEFRMLFAAALLALAVPGFRADDDIYDPTYYADDTYDPTYSDYNTGYDAPGYDNTDYTGIYTPPDDYYETDDTGYDPSYAVYPPAKEYDDTYYTTPSYYVAPDVVYPTAYGTSYGAGSGFADLWQLVWTRVHLMKYQVDVVEEYRNDIIAQINKLSQKVFGWCRSKRNTALP